MSTATRLQGWGGAVSSMAEVVRPTDVDAVLAALADPGGRGALPRGAGRAYGDAASNAGGLVLDLTGLDRVGPVELDGPGGPQVTVGGGATLRQVLDTARRHGCTLPVVPGTAHVTVGGAIASDVHGKSHRRDGSFGQHVTRLLLATPTGLHDLAPDDSPFWATVGGMGLTGVVVEATLRLQPVETDAVVAGSQRTRDLAETVEQLERAGVEHHTCVAWLDLLSSRRTGRGVVEWSDPATPADLRAHGSLGPHRPVPFPVGADEDTAPDGLGLPPVPANVVRPAAVRVANALRWRRAPAEPATTVLARDTARFPLDALDGWNRLYGPRGFVQHQSVVPPDRVDVLERLVGTIRDRGLPVTLAVLKRLGASSPGHLSFPAPGWTLAIDLPAGVPELRDVLDRFDTWVADAGGRIYLTKDARMAPDLLLTMYPRLTAWREVRDRLDPDRVLASDLGRRLGVVADA